MFVGGVILPLAIAGAYPEAAPWGAANPDTDESCHACHYDYEPVFESAALVIEGLPPVARDGQAYALRILFSDASAAVSGFQLIATAGSFESREEGMEIIGSAARSTRVKDREAGFDWPLLWRPAGDRGEDVTFYLAASSANDDLSPFGDTIHYRQFTVKSGPSGREAQ